MCGITGFFSNTQNFSSLNFSNANNIIRHRGPDDYGYITIDNSLNVTEYFDENLENFKEKNKIIGAFGFRRLSIIDTSKKGHQPMSDIKKNIWVIFNGEIYNHVELREELIDLGYEFKTRTDTEVIVNSYKEWGNKCVLKFNGMWSFSILDIDNKQLFCSRDRLGIKPFYYSINDKRFIFSSEIKQIIEYQNNKCELNEKLLFDFLAFGAYGNHSNETYFENILKLEPGCSLIYDIEKNNLTTYKYWDIESIKTIENSDENKVFKKIKTILTDSIKIRLRSDVPIGTALSGGLDSSGIVCLVDKINEGKTKQNNVFTVTSNEENIRDPYYANIIKEKIETNSFETNFSEQHNIKDLYKFIYHQEEPLQSSSIFGSWYLYNFIKSSGITVNLDGQGADELMGGYYRFPFRKYFLQLLYEKKIRLFFKQIKKVSSLNSVSSFRLLFEVFKSLFVDILRLKGSIYFKFKINPLKNYLNKEFKEKNFKKSLLIRVHENYRSKRFKNKIKEDSLKLTKHTNLPGILRQVDRNSMAASVEARVPFLDHRLVEYLFSLPNDLILRNGFSKYCFRMAMTDVIPDEVLWRKDKEGFKMPEYEILKENKNFVIELLDNHEDDRNLYVRNIKKLFLKSIKNKKHYNNIVWRSVTYLIWKESFIEH